MPVARPESSYSRVIAHIDMDCFYVQVEQRKQPDLRGLPTAVVQYNEWKGGGLIAVSYEARKYGVKRSMRGDEAKQVCPQIRLVQVPVARGKADLNTYRDAGVEVVSILARKGRCERASIDEVYLDLTDAAETMLAETPPERLEVVAEEATKSHILGLNHENGTDTKENVREWLCRSEADLCDKLLACGALIVAELRMQVLKETEFTCSAGVAHNKILAKLSSAMNKPAQQTVVPSSSVESLLESLPIKKMKHLGGKLGSSLQNDLGASTVGDLLQFSKDKLQECYGINTGTWLWNIARGISGEEVQGRLLPKSHGSGKTFPGPRALKTIASVQHWLNELCEELSERLQSDLEKNKRIAQTLSLHVRAYKSSDTDSLRNFPSKSCPLRYGTAKIQEDALNLFQSGLREYMGSFGTKGNQKNVWGVTGLSVSASKYFDIPSGTCPIMKYFSGHYASHSLNQSEDAHSLKKSQDEHVPETVLPSPSGNRSFSEMNFTKQQMEITREDMKNPRCLSFELVQDDFTEETSLSTSGTKSCYGINNAQQQRASPEEKPFNTVTNSCQNRPKQKIDTSKDKETYSIFRFFKRNDPCSSSERQEMTENADVNAPSSSHTEVPKEGFLEAVGTNNYSSRSLQSDQSKAAWSYKIDDIDPSVIDELPHEIQEEVRAWLRPYKRQNAVRKGSSIANYFLPTKKT